MELSSQGHPQIGPLNLQKEPVKFPSESQKLVGVDHHQEARGADQALSPDAGVADGQADDTAQADVNLHHLSGSLVNKKSMEVLKEGSQHVRMHMEQVCCTCRHLGVRYPTCQNNCPCLCPCVYTYVRCLDIYIHICVH